MVIGAPLLAKLSLASLAALISFKVSLIGEKCVMLSRKSAGMVSIWVSINAMMGTRLVVMGAPPLVILSLATTVREEAQVPETIAFPIYRQAQ